MSHDWKTLHKLFDTLRDMTAEMAEGIDDEQFHTAQGDGGHSPAWITGHLALGMDFALNMMGDRPEKLEEMMPVFGPGSSGDVGTDWTRDQLVGHLRSAGDKVSGRLPELTPSFLDEPQQTPFLQDKLPLVGDLLGHLVSTHLALHAGQLSQWRRSHGMPSILNL